MEKVRIDKWLWSIRVFKSRTLATDACKGGKVKIKGEAVKASYMMVVGEIITVRKDGFNFEYKALELIEKRVGAPIAATCYEDVTTEEEKNKYNAWFNNSLKTNEIRERGTGRPTKRERREIDRFKD
jgi:ribosome-associated heat shock protein Hsp15